MALRNHTPTIGMLVACISCVIAARASSTETKLLEQIRESGMYLVDLRNEGYRIVFPQKRDSWVGYANPKSDYIYSVVTPNGRSLLAVKRTFESMPPRDILVTRTLARAGGPEDIVSSRIVLVQQCAASPDERFIVFAGRLLGSPPAENKRDGIFLLDRNDNSFEYLGAFEKAGLNESVRSLSVADQGRTILYEETGVIVMIKRREGRFKETRHRGQLPVLLPGGEEYLYSDQGWLIRSSGSTRQSVLRVPVAVGAIRVSPDGRFVAFGVQARERATASHLEICDLSSRLCVAGPSYDDWIPGRETFWIKP